MKSDFWGDGLSIGEQRGEGRFGGASQSWAHHADLVMYARRVLGDRSDTAEDIVQEAYLRLLGLAASDEAPTSARPWLFRVVRNLAIDERRSVARRADPVAEPDILGTAATDDTATLVEQRESINEAFRDIAALPPRERRAIEMDQAGFGAQAIATELGTTPNAVHQALFRARRRMRNTRAVVWGLIPVGLAPFMLRLSDPALAMTMTSLPPGGLPIGRGLPVAGLVAAAMVGGTVAVPPVDSKPAQTTNATVFARTVASAPPPAAPAQTPAKAVSANKGPSANSGPGKAADDDDDETSGNDDRSGTNRGRDSGGDRTSGKNRGRDDSGSKRGSGSGKRADDDASDDDNGSSGKGKSGSGKVEDSTPSGSATGDGSPDTPDEPDAPDDSD